MLSELRHEDTAPLRLAAGHLLDRVRGAREQIREAKAEIERTRHDALLSFPGVLDNVSADGMIALEALALDIGDRVARASVPQLLQTYRAALEAQSIRGYVEARAIESLLGSGAVGAANEQELPLLTELRETIEAAQLVRLPSSLPDFDQLAAELDRLEGRASLLQLAPIGGHDPRASQAAEIFAERVHELSEAGAASDADDQAALRRDAAVNE